jgi:hypothetical protein
MYIRKEERISYEEAVKVKRAGGKVRVINRRGEGGEYCYLLGDKIRGFEIVTCDSGTLLNHNREFYAETRTRENT